jgi:tellurite resistance protein TerC
MALHGTLAGVSWTWWLGFHLIAAALVALDTLLTRSRQGQRHTRLFAWISTAILVAGAAGFASWIALEQGRQPALDFVAGYTVELSLSVDNLFVFLVLFEGFGIGPRRQHKALVWGVCGAIVLRGICIATGVELLDRFAWISWIFGVFLLYAAFRLLRGGSPGAAIPGWVRNLHPGKNSLLPVIVAVEITDLLFAVDSIPAVLAISHNPFVVYTSNIAAVLGLRSLYFALASLLDRLHFLHYGLGVLLGFVAFKMLAAHWIEIPIVLSLAIMGAILAVCALASVMFPKNREQGSGIRDQ